MIGRTVGASQLHLQEFITGYITCALWSGTDQMSESGGEPLDRNYSVEDLAEEARHKIETECQAFLSANSDDMDEFCAHNAIQDRAGRSEASVMECAGHDLWLTRNGHGAGFWDRGAGDAGDRLSAAASALGESLIYVGDDGKLYI
jgi:hypothetical protein